MSGGTVVKNPKWMTIVGWVLSVLPCLLLFLSAFMKLSKNPQAVEGFKEMRFPESSLLPIGIAEAVCTVIYLIPRTAVLGATLLVGYLGGAVVVHVLKGDSIVTPIVVGVVLWLGLFLRMAQVRSLTPVVR